MSPFRRQHLLSLAVLVTLCLAAILWTAAQPQDADATSAIQLVLTAILCGVALMLVWTLALVSRQWERAHAAVSEENQLLVERHHAREAKESRFRHRENNERLLNNLVAGAPISIFGVDREGNFTLNKGTVLDEDQVQMNTLAHQNVFSLYAHQPQIISSIEAAMSGELVRNTLHLSNGNAYDACYVPVSTDDQFPGGHAVVGIYTDVTDRVALERQLDQLASHDELTGVLNRRAFIAIVERHRTERDGLLMLLDLNEFKCINDTLGHKAGDEVIKTVARRINSATRGAATVGRYGGDEFLVYLPTTNAEDRNELANAVLQRISEPMTVHTRGRTHQVNVGASAGACVLVRDASSSLSELIAMADEAMYEAKQNKVARVVFARTSPTLCQVVPIKDGA